MKTKTIYIDDDGTEFDNELMCLGYEWKSKDCHEMVPRDHMRRVAENAFLLCAAMFGKTRDDFIDRNVDMDCAPYKYDDYTINKFQDWIADTAESFEKEWEDADLYDYTSSVFDFARKSFSGFKALKAPKVSEREERIAQNAYWIYDTLVTLYRKDNYRVVDKYFDIYPQDMWVAEKAIEFENHSHDGDDYPSEVEDFVKSKLEKIKEDFQ